MEATISIFPVLLIAIIFIVGIVVGVVVLAVTLGNRSKQKILAQQQQQPAVGYACPYCGAALPAGAAVCPACGRPLGGQQE